MDQGIERPGFTVVSQSRENMRMNRSGVVKFLKSLRQLGSERITKITSSLFFDCQTADPILDDNRDSTKKNSHRKRPSASF